MNAEIIAKMLTSAVRMGGVGSTANDKLTKSELAGLLAGLSSVQFDFALAKYGDDDDAKRALLNHITTHTVQTAIKNKWQPRDSRVLQGMARVAVFEVFKDCQCTKCNGTGFDMTRACKCCNGTGKKSMSKRSIARELGINEKTYREIWASRYAVIYEYVAGIDLDLWCALKKVDTPAINH